MRTVYLPGAASGPTSASRMPQCSDGPRVLLWNAARPRCADSRAAWSAARPTAAARSAVPGRAVQAGVRRRRSILRTTGCLSIENLDLHRPLRRCRCENVKSIIAVASCAWRTPGRGATRRCRSARRLQLVRLLERRDVVQDVDPAAIGRNDDVVRAASDRRSTSRRRRQPALNCVQCAPSSSE